MSNVGIAARARTETGNAAYDVALITEPGQGDGLVAALNHHGLRFSATDADSLIAGSAAAGAAAVVLCVDDATAGFAACIESLARTLPQKPLVVVCSQGERRDVRAALVAGAAGVVHARDVETALAPCIRAVLAGQTCVPRGHWRQVDPPALSAREKQILGLVVMGYMNSQIAAQLFLAESTVKSHLSSAFGKLGVRSRNEAVDLILDPGRGVGVGILSLVGEGEPLESTPTAGR